MSLGILIPQGTLNLCSKPDYSEYYARLAELKRTNKPPVFKKNNFNTDPAKHLEWKVNTKTKK